MSRILRRQGYDGMRWTIGFAITFTSFPGIDFCHVEGAITAFRQQQVRLGKGFPDPGDIYLT